VSVVKAIAAQGGRRGADALLPTLALRFEQRTWKKRGLRRDGYASTPRR